MIASSVGGAGRVARAFAAARAEGRCALIPYITAGDPDLGRTRSIARALGRAGADLVEIGVPFSDPIADGPVNQRAAERALRNGVTLRLLLKRAINPLALRTIKNRDNRRLVGAQGPVVEIRGIVQVSCATSLVKLDVEHLT